MSLTQVMVAGASDSRLILIRMNDEPHTSATPLSRVHSTGPKVPRRDPSAVDSTRWRPGLREGRGMRQRRVAGRDGTPSPTDQAERYRSRASGWFHLSCSQRLKAHVGW